MDPHAHKTGGAAPSGPALRRGWVLRAALVIGLVALASAPQAARAQAATPTCVEVVTRRPDRADLARFVRAEVDRHPTHRAVDPGDTPLEQTPDALCPSRLRVELIEVKEGRFLTGRINEAVPHRERIEGDAQDAAAFERAVIALLKVVLHNDPVRLYGPDRDNFLSRTGGALRRRGQNLFGADIEQVTAVVDGEVLGLPGAALQARRELDGWLLGIRAGAAFGLGARTQDTARLKFLADAAVHVDVFTSPLAESSFFWGGEAGLQFQRFEGPATLLPGEGSETATTAIFGLGARAGYELFRTADMRVNLHARLFLPVMKSADKEAGVVDAWVPSLTVGAGVLF